MRCVLGVITKEYKGYCKIIVLQQGKKNGISFCGKWQYEIPLV